MKKLLIFIALLGLLCSCGAPKEMPYLADPVFATDEPLPDYDFQLDFYTAIGFTEMCASEDAYYFTERDLSTDLGAQFIWYYDKQSGLSGKLCTRPECLHSGSTCNAYLDSSVNALSFYDGRLYCYYRPFNNEKTANMCISMNPDGTGRRTEMDAPLEPCGGDSISFIHRGYIYMAAAESEVHVAEATNTPRLYCWNIKTGEETLLYEGPSTSKFINVRAMPLGNDIYFAYSETTDDGNGTINTLCRIDTGTREVETCFSNQADYFIASIEPIKDDGVYMICSRPEKSCIGRYDFKTGEISYSGEGAIIGTENMMDGKVIGYTDEEYIMGIGQSRYCGVIYSFDGEKIAETAALTEIDGDKFSELSNKNGSVFTTLMGCDGENVFIRFDKIFASSTGDVTKQSIIYYAFPLDGSEPFELWRTEKVYEPVAPVKGSAK